MSQEGLLLRDFGYFSGSCCFIIFYQIKMALFLSDLKIINKLGLCSAKISHPDECRFKFGAYNFVSAYTGLTSHRRTGASICMMV